MPQGTPIQTNFAGGEWSPEMLGRVDFERYRTALARATNMVASPRGPAMRRVGTRLAGRAQDESRVGRLVDFIRSAEEAYGLEFGHQRVRIRRRDGSLVTSAPELIVNGSFAADLTGWTDRSALGARIAWDPSSALRLDADAGANRVVNGTFDGGLDGWTLVGQVTWLSASQAARLVSTGRFEEGFIAQRAAMEQAVSVVPGATYTLELRLSDVNRGVQIRLGSTSFGSDYHSSLVGNGLHTRSVTPTTGTVYVSVEVLLASALFGSSHATLDDVRLSTTAVAHGEQAVTTTPAADYRLGFTVLEGPVTLRVGTASLGQEVVADTEYQAGTYTRSLTAPGASLVLGLRTAVPGRRVDDVTLRLSAPAPIELTTPYAESELPRLDWTQSLDVLYLVDGLHQPRKLRRFSETSWDLAPVSFRLPPTTARGEAPATTLTPGATTGTGVTFTAGTSVFLAADVGRDLVGVGVPGRAEVKTQAGTSCTADILEPFASVNPIASGQWRLDGSPYTSCTPNVQDVGATGTLILGVAGWRSTDVGRFVKLHGGLCELTGFTSTTVVAMLVRSRLSTTAAAQAETWSLEEPTWSDTRGWPERVGFHDGRLWMLTGEALDGSVSDDYENYRAGSAEADALHFRLGSGQFTAGRWLASLEDLLVGTSGPVFRLRKTGETLTPTAPPSVRRAARPGSLRARPVVIDPYVLYIDDSREQLVEMVFDFTVEGYQSGDAAIFATHLPPPGLAEVVYQARPNPTLWARRIDGALFAITYLPRHEILGWFPVALGGGGAVESLMVLPSASPGVDAVWALVRRTINGATVRTIEILDPKRLVYLDASVTYQGAPTTTITGLDHVEGETVQAIADGAEVADLVVAGGQVTLPVAASVVEVGLASPASFTTLPHEGTNPAGTALGRQKRYTKLFLYVRDTAGCLVNGEPLPAIEPEDEVRTAVPGSTAIIQVDNLEGWQRTGQITVEQRQPRPLTVLALFGELVTG